MSVLSSSLSRHKFDFLGERYTRIEKLGFGGMGHVYSAFDRFLNKKVAIKVLGSNAASDEQLIRFQKEAKLTSRLSHPNIVNVIDFGVSPSNDLYLIMELVEGRSLQEKLDQDGPLSNEQAVILSIQICEGLLHAHKRGIIHRDIKPSNIMIDESCSWMPQAKIVDFGLAKLESDEPGFVSNGRSILTPLYSSPEQINSKDLDSRTDIYSLGCLIFAMLTGEPPYRGANTLDTLDMHLNLASPELVNATEYGDFPVELEKIIHKAMQKNPTLRYQSAQEVKEDLEDVPVYGDSALTSESLHDFEREIKVESYSLLRRLLIYALSFGLFLLAGYGAIFVTFGEAPKQNEPHIVLKSSPFADINHDDFYRTTKNGVTTWIATAEVSDENMRTLKKAKVQELQLQVLLLSKVAFDSISGKSIYRLIIEDSVIDNRFVNQIGTLKDLHFLDLSYCNITDEGLASIGKLSNLDTLVLNGCDRITNKSANVIVDNFPNLTKLNLDHCGIDGKAINSFAVLKQLSRISVRKLSLTDENVLELCQFPNLAYIDVSENEMLTEQALEYLGKSNTLRILGMAKIDSISEKSLARFRKIHDNRIQFLVNTGKLHITNDDLTEIVTGIIDYSK